MGVLNYLVETLQATKKARVASQVRISHFKNQGKTDKIADELMERQLDLEKWIIKNLGGMVEAHPAYPWFSQAEASGMKILPILSVWLILKKQILSQAYGSSLAMRWKMAQRPSEYAGKS